jgi:hypothetical protein
VREEEHAQPFTFLAGAPNVQIAMEILNTAAFIALTGLGLNLQKSVESINSSGALAK